MSTKNLIPQGSGEGGIGIPDTTWGQAHFDSGHFNKELYLSGQSIGAIVSQGGLGGKWDDATTPGDIYYTGGNVGIGTTNPSARLHVSRLDQNLTGSALTVARYDTSQDNRPTTPIFNVLNGHAGGAEVFKIRGDGNSEFNIQGPDGGYLSLSRTYSAGETASAGEFLKVGAYFLSGTYNAVSEVGVHDNTNSQGIGYVRMTTAETTVNNRMLYFNNNGDLCSANNFGDLGQSPGSLIGNQPSDERIKDIDPDFQYGLNEALNLKPISFRFKNDTTNTKNLGFGAQTTMDIIPEVVFDSKECIDGYEQDPDDSDNQKPLSDNTKLTMSYVGLIPVLTKAIQEQQEIIEDLKSRIKTLEK